MAPPTNGAIEHYEHHPERHPTQAVMAPPSPEEVEIDNEPDHTVNPWSRIRYTLREYFGEFIGTMVLIIFGNGVNCQVVLNNWTQGSYLSISFGWGIGVM
jgi:aquaglyceroporin related protein